MPGEHPGLLSGCRSGGRCGGHGTAPVAGDEIDAQVVADAAHVGELAAPDRRRAIAAARAGDHRDDVDAGEQRRGDVEDEAVDQVGFEERADGACAALDQDLQDAEASEVVEQPGGVAGPGQARLHPCVGGRCAEHDAQWVAAVDVAHRERRVVGAHGARTDDDRVALGAQPVGIGACRRAGDPLRRAVGRGDRPVDRDRQLADHVWPSAAAVVQVRLQLGRGLVGQHTDGHLDAGGAQRGDTAPGDALRPDRGWPPPRDGSRRRRRRRRTAACARGGRTAPASPPACRRVRRRRRRAARSPRRVRHLAARSPRPRRASPRRGQHHRTDPRVRRRRACGPVPQRRGPPASPCPGPHRDRSTLVRPTDQQANGLV